MAGNFADGVPQTDSPTKKQHSDVDFLGGGEEVDDSPIEEVRLTVPIIDDPTEPALTFRTWVLGLASCCFLSFVNQFFSYRSNQLSISSISAQIVLLPLGKLMAAILPTRRFPVPFSKWSFTMNPGPFTLKEHVLITIFANTGSSSVYAIYVITIVKAFYRRRLHPVAAFLLAHTTQMVGYGGAGVFRKFLVDSPYMWWPSNLVQVSHFRALHEKEKRPKGGKTRLQFFLIVFISSFAYYIIPGYLFPSISTISIACLIWKDSVTAQQIGSGLKGLGIGSFGLDWATIAGFLGSPLATPGFAILNTLCGFFLFVYIVVPIAYWTNSYEAKRFPIFSSHTFDFSGKTYNISQVLDKKTLDIDQAGYHGYSKLYLSPSFAYLYGISFATLTATISHVLLFHGKTTWDLLWKRTTEKVGDQVDDVHTRIMKKNYKQIPQWWFYTILVLMVVLTFVAYEGFDKQLQLPWWGLLMSRVIALVFILPIGIIQATTNTQVGLNLITELLIGYLYPGRPLANVEFKTYGYICMSQALSLVGDFKLGHYMKIPPRSMFIAQLVGTIVATTVYFGTAWWLLTAIENICDPDKLPVGSPWTCPGADVFYNASIIWGVIGPLRMFTNQGIYPQMNWFFLIGLVAPIPVWLLQRKYPEKKWIKLINMPLIFSGAGGLFPVKTIHFLMWGTVGLFFSFYVFRVHKSWWARHNYILSAALDAGVSFLGVFLYFTLQSYEVYGPSWWGLEADDHCSLAACPTAPGIVKTGCPTF